MHHQTKVDEHWYQSAMKALDKSTSFAPQSIVQDEKVRRGLAPVATLIEEIFGLSVIGYGMQLLHWAINKQIPTLPRVQDFQQETIKPTMMNIVQMLKPNK